MPWTMFTSIWCAGKFETRLRDDTMKFAILIGLDDEKGAVGRRYRRQDEAGTPYCITVDGQTLTDQTVTIRDRDSLEQWRVKVDDCVDEIRQRLS